MKKQFLVTVAFILATSTIGAQTANELLRAVDPTLARRLEAYNSSSLKDQVYFARRYRLVRADVNLLMEHNPITVTPFDDVAPIRIEPLPETSTRNGDDIIHWRGRFKDDPLYGVLGFETPVTISAHAFDLDESGQALVSALNRFEFSRLWTFDEGGSPALEPLENGVARSAIVGPPPQTPEQIERHKRVKRLTKEAFFAVDAKFDLPYGSTYYILAPLRYTPKYSVIYEISRDTVRPILADGEPGDPGLTAIERAAADRYHAFRESLPKENGKPVVGDVP